MIVRRVAGWAGELLVTLGVLVLLFAAWQLWWTDVVSNRAQTQIADSPDATFAARKARRRPPHRCPRTASPIS